MRIADVRRACLALIHHRLSAEAPAADPLPVALGWHLENSRASANAMTALCAGAMAGSDASGWQPSPALRALLSEYGAVRQEPQAGGRARRSSLARDRRVADALH